MQPQRRPQHWHEADGSQQQQEEAQPQTRPQHYLLTSPPKIMPRRQHSQLGIQQQRRHIVEETHHIDDSRGISTPAPSVVAATPPSSGSLRRRVNYPSPRVIDTYPYDPTPPASNRSDQKRLAFVSPSHDHNGQQSHVIEEDLLVGETEHVDYSRRDSNSRSAMMLVATPPADNRSDQKRIHLSSRLKRQLSDNLPRQRPEVIVHTPNPIDENDNHHDNDGDDSISIHNSETMSEDLSRELSTGEWTLQSFMDHQLHASYLNGGFSPSRKKGPRGMKRGLSLVSATSNSPGVDSAAINHTEVEAKGLGAGKIAKPLGANGRVGCVPRKRRILLKLVLVCTTFIVLFGSAFLLSNSATKTGMNNSKQNWKDSDWHPLYPHSKRTADVEVPPVPSGKKPKKEPVMGGADAKDATNHNAIESDGASMRTLQEEATDVFGGGQTPADQDDSTTSTLIQGDVAQNLCPASHTLISQALILRSSFGNIFSITTPDQPNLKRRGDSGGSGHKIFSRQKSSSEAGEEANDNRQDRGEGVGDAKARKANHEDNHVFDRKLQADVNGGGKNYADTGDYNDIDAATESINDGTGVETITVKSLSLRMSDYRPEEENHFEVWLYTGSGDDIEMNSNDLDNDPTNDNVYPPSKGEYQASRAKFTDWQLISEGKEKDLIPDTDFFDHNGHIFNIGSGTTIGPLGRLDGYENMEDVTSAAQDWNAQKLGSDGGMTAITADGEVTDTFFFKIPEEKFTPLKLPKYEGKLTLFVTLDRIGLQYGYAAETEEFDNVDVMKHDYVDQAPSLDVLNGNVNLRMHVGEGVIFYPWMEEDVFYQTRRFLGKIWYDAEIPCEYVPATEVLDVNDQSVRPNASATTMEPTIDVTTVPSSSPSENGGFVAADLQVSVLIKDGPLPPMPNDVKEIFEDTLLDFVDDEFGNFCPLTWNEGATVVDQHLSPIGGLPSGGTSHAKKRRKRNDNGVSGGRGTGTKQRDQSDTDEGHVFVRRFLREVLEPILYPERQARHRLLNAITLLDVSTVVDALYDSNTCPDKKPEELANLIETYINDNSKEFLDKLKAAHDYFKDSFGVSADAVGISATVKSAAIASEEDETNKPAVIGGIMAALLLFCLCCCIPLLVIRRRKLKENETIREDIEWARPVDEDDFPPLGGYCDDGEAAGGEGAGSGEDENKLWKRPDGDFEDEGESPPDIELIPIPPGIRPPEDDTEMLYSTKWLERKEPDKDAKKPVYGMPGRMPDEKEEKDPSSINIYPGGDYKEGEGKDDPHNLRHIEKEEVEIIGEDWKPDHYEPGGGIHSYDRPQKSPMDINKSCNRLPQKEEKVPLPPEKLSIKQLVLQRRKEIEKKKQAMRHVEMIEKGDQPDVDQVFPKSEPDSRIKDLMYRIQELEKDRAKKYQQSVQNIEDSDFEQWQRLKIADKDISSDEDIKLRKVEMKEKKKKKEGKDYMLNFEDLDAYNKALAVHQDAYIHKWVKVKVKKGEEANEGGNLDEIEMEGDFGGDVTNEGTLRECTAGDGTVGSYLGDIRVEDDEDPKATIKDEIVVLVDKVLPEQLEDVGELLKQFEGREEALLNSLRAKAEKLGTI